jgi:nucleoside-diphosphate-sugar epimerase
MPSLFITGASGLVGGYILTQAISQGYQVKALIRNQIDAQKYVHLSGSVQWIEGDIFDVALLEECCEGVDFVVHAAALVSFRKKDKRLLYKTNQEGTANIVNVCLKKQVKKLCYISSIAAIARGDESQPISETTKWETTANNTDYGNSKYLGEVEVWRGIAEGLNAVIVNPSVVLGVGTWHRSSLQFIDYVGKNNKFYPIGSINVVDVRDVSDIVLQLLQSQVVAEKYILNAANLPFQIFFSMVASKLNTTPPFLKITPFLSEIAWRVIGILSLFFPKLPPFTKDTARTSRKHYTYDNSKIVKELNFKFTPINDTIEWVCEGYLKTNA